jgi:hypothetical protein
MTIRAGMCSLKDPDDDYAYQILKGDVERIRIALAKLSIAIEGADPNALPDGVSLQDVRVCVDGVEKTMQVLGTPPA